METEKLFDQDPFLQTFTARVLDCQPSKSGFAVTLDRTAFYPEGGGQPADHGTLEEAAVTDVHQRDGVIVHTTQQPLEIGRQVTGRIHWARRFDHMQQHSGEHILSGILCSRHHCDNVGFHLGADTVTIDYNADISWEQALEAQDLANRVIWADAPVEVSYPSPQALSALDYRSKKELEGAVRIVTFPGADCCACCGTHVLRAGQVGLVKVLSCQKFRDGVRMEILCGQRAAAFLDAAYNQLRSIGQSLSVKPLEALPAVERLEGELAAAKDRVGQLEDQLFAHLAQQQAGLGDVLLFQSPMRPDAVRKLADAVARRCGGLAAVFAGDEEGRWNYALVRSDGGDIASLVKDLNAALSGRGGGRGGYAQGSVQGSRSQIEAFFHTEGEGAPF